MNEWKKFDVITKGNGMWLIDSKGNKLLDGVASMWCNSQTDDAQLLGAIVGASLVWVFYHPHWEVTPEADLKRRISHGISRNLMRKCRFLVRFRGSS